MNNRLRLPGFPEPEQQDIVRFHVLKKLNYTNRIMLYLVLLISGFVLQFYTLEVWPGALFLICATVLTLVRGYDSRVRLSTFKTDSTWTKVDMDKIGQIEELDEKISKWDRDPLDISNARGFLTFAFALLTLIVINMLTKGSSSYRQTGAILTADIIILILPLWFNGIRRILKQGNLLIKIDIVKKMEAYFHTVKEEGENFNPFLMLAKDKKGKSVPTDCRFSITFDNMPDDFYGIQAQINLNIVQGTSYPYFYCVIAAKPSFGLVRYTNKITAPKNIVIKRNENYDAEVFVIRQRTTNTSGYHTKINDCKRIFDIALKAARTILSESEKEGMK
ncbi:MAG: hypothetical protein GX213_12260 [Clostridiaceae bacterium]|nr:hypothetical protein [Clostridiaceae bacterium]